VNTENIFFDELFEHGRIIELSRGDVLHDVHDECKSLGKILKGKLRLSRLLSSGREIILKEFGPGEIYAELLVFTGERFPGRLSASSKTSVAEVNLKHVLEHLTDRNALITFMSEISRKTAHLANKIEILSLKTVKQKIAFSLLTEDKIFLSSVSEFSDNIGCSREALSRALTELEQGNVITRQGNYLRIADKQALEDLL